MSLDEVDEVDHIPTRYLAQRRLHTVSFVEDTSSRVEHQSPRLIHHASQISSDDEHHYLKTQDQVHSSSTYLS